MSESESSAIEERDTVLRCLAGESAAWGFIVERYSSLLYATAYLMSHDRGLAEDATQEALLAGWRRLETFDPARPLRPWLLRILVNEVLQRRRRRMLAFIPLLKSHEGVRSADRTPESQAEKDWEREEIRQALRSLPADSARVVLLRFFAELSPAEIGEVLSLPEGTVKSRLHRALKKLGKELAKRHFVDLPNEDGGTEEARKARSLS